MSLVQRISEAARSTLLGISAYARSEDELVGSLDLDSSLVERIRRAFGGQIAQPPRTQTRWYLADLEGAERLADSGDLSAAGRLIHAARKDGILAGVLSTRTDGLVRLPKRFRGDPDVVRALELGHDSVRSVFDEMFPSSELALLAADGLFLGVGVAELLPVLGRDYPVLVRLDPQFLRYVWTENQWYYQSVAGRLPITPGDGRWILHCPGGRVAPWQSALWRGIGGAWIRKEHAQLHKDNWEAKLANPARVATAPAGAAEAQRQAYFQQVMEWGINTVFGLLPGYSVQLLESNGRGWESFDKTIEQQNETFVLSIAGQKVTTDGGAGFQNSDIHKSIRADLIQATADGLAYTINTQGIPLFVANRFGIDAIVSKRCAFEWDVTPPKDRNSEASSMVQVAAAITQLTDALAAHGIALDVPTIADRFAIPTTQLPDNVVALPAPSALPASTPASPATPSPSAVPAVPSTTPTQDAAE